MAMEIADIYLKNLDSNYMPGNQKGKIVILI